MDKSPTLDMTLRVTGIDLDAEHVGEVLATRFANVLWEENAELTTMSVTVSRTEMVAEVVDIARQLEHAIQGVKVVGVYRDFVNTTDIATRVDMTREAIRKWSARDDFPQPLDIVGNQMKIWAWAQVIAWLKENRGFEFEENLPTLEEMTQLENCLMRNPDHTTVQWASHVAGAKTVSFEKMNRAKPPVFVGGPGRGHGGTAFLDASLVATSDRDKVPA